MPITEPDYSVQSALVKRYEAQPSLQGVLESLGRRPLSHATKAREFS